MDARVQKLAIKLGDTELAQALVRAGLDTPRKIKRATDKELLAVPGVGQARRAELRKRFPQANK